MKMNEVDRYVRDVLRNIQAPPRDKERIEADLRAHIDEAMAAGEPASKVLDRLGPPAEVAAEFMSGVKLCYAAFLRRLAGFAIDVVVMSAVAMPLFGLGILAATLVPTAPQGLDYVVGAALIALVAFFWGTAAAIFLLYLPILDGRYGQTVGKKLLGMRVLREGGAPIGYREAFLRWLPYYFEFLFIDALFILFTDMRQRAFDIVARTIVVREECQ